jgi:hypothetical protein
MSASHMWLVASVLDNAALDVRIRICDDIQQQEMHMELYMKIVKSLRHLYLQWVSGI